MVQKMYAALATSVLGPDLLGCFFFKYFCSCRCELGKSVLAVSYQDSNLLRVCFYNQYQTKALEEHLRDLWSRCFLFSQFTRATPLSLGGLGLVGSTILCS